MHDCWIFSFKKLHKINKIQPLVSVSHCPHAEGRLSPLCDDDQCFFPLQPGVLPLKPGPVYAIDGDSGINEEIEYSFLNGEQPG